MKNSKIIIHVGLPKTASTYLQNVVYPQLKNVTYIGRPYTQENYAFNSLQYADNSLYDSSAIRDEMHRIEKEISQGGTILISDELLSGYPFYNFINRGIIAERLSKVTPDAEIILFFRGQADLILSMYNQFVKMGSFDNRLDNSFLYKPGAGFSLEKWLSGNRDWNIRNRFIVHKSLFSTEHFLYSNLYSLYSDLFKSVHVFLYEDFRENQQSCLERLTAILSSELSSDLDLEILVNKSLKKDQLQTKLLQNKLSHIVSNSRVGRAISLLVAKILSKTVPDNEDSNRDHVISLLIERGIFSDNYKLNEKLSLGMEKYPNKYFGDSI